MKILISKPAYSWVIQQNFRLTHQDKYLYFLSLISLSSNPKYLSSKYLRSSLGKNGNFTHKTIITNLIEAGILQMNSSYTVGKSSKSFKLSKQYLCKELIEYTIINKKIINKIKVHQDEQFKLLPAYIKQMQTNLSELQFNGTSIEVGHINKSHYGRITNFITKSKRIERDKLLHKSGQRLVEMDLSASQPYFLGLMVAKSLFLYSLDEVMPDDLRLYFELLAKGEFYEFFANKLNINLLDKDIKDNFKKSFFKQYLFNNQWKVINNTKIGKIFIEYFPTIHNFVLKNFIDTTDTLASALQNYEANLIVGTLYKGLTDAHIWAVTLHDAIIVLENNYNEVLDIFNKLIAMHISPVKIKTSIISNKEFCTPITENIDKDNNSTTAATSTNNVATFELESQESETMGVQNKKEQIYDTNRNIIDKLFDNWDFTTNGKITIRKIAELTGISKKTIQKHWKTFKMAALSINLQNKEIVNPIIF